MIPIPIPRVDTEKKPEHVGVGLMQGFTKFGDQVGEGAKKLWHKPQEGLQSEGKLGAVKGVGEGLLGLTIGVGKGACDLVGSTLDGVRATPDAVADATMKDRARNKHGVEGEGEGELLESYVEEDDKEPAHLGKGLVSGATGLGRALSSGLTDLAMKPVEGAKEGGALGFAKGLGFGALGFGTKAASGTLDLATNLVKGARNTPDAIGRAVEENGGVAGTAANLQRGVTTTFSAVRTSVTNMAKGEAAGSTEDALEEDPKGKGKGKEDGSSSSSGGVAGAAANLQRGMSGGFSALRSSVSNAASSFQAFTGEGHVLNPEAATAPQPAAEQPAAELETAPQSSSAPQFKGDAMQKQPDC